jgi:hypothetical protein
MDVVTRQPLAPNGGSARGYQELSAPLAILTTAEQAGGQAVCLCIASAGRECALLPPTGRARWPSSPPLA